MNDAEFERQKQRVLQQTDWWIPAIGLRWWKVHLEWLREEKDSDRGPGAVAAECDADWRYCEATIRWFLPAIAAADDEELEYIVVHELMHIFLNEMRQAEDLQAHEERVATHLANGFLWSTAAARKGEPGGFDYAKAHEAEMYLTAYHEAV